MTSKFMHTHNTAPLMYMK